jgi:glycosyltransferase involved in cell wall biosynthesis
MIEDSVTRSNPDVTLPELVRGRTWVVIPVYNEGAVVGDVLRELVRTFPHVVCVDDGSSDDSAAVVRSVPGVHLVRHPVNLGQGAALQTGVEYARDQPDAAYFVTFDADGQHRVADAAAMVARLVDEEIDVVLGTRFAGAGTTEVPLVKRFVLRTVVLLAPRNRRLGLTDAHNGLRAFTRTVATVLDLKSVGMAHASEFVALLDHRGWRVAEQPVTIRYTEYSMSKGQSLLNGVNILVDHAVHGPRKAK